MDEAIKISAVVITFNEEKNIGRCLASLKSIADEIIVVDSFSNDETEKICENYNVRFIKNKFEGHIQQKNFALQQASFPYVLALDADEEISDKLAESILQVKRNWKFDGYSFNRLTNYCGKWIRYCGWYPDAKLRLWDKNKGNWAGINPHDIVTLDESAKISHISGDLNHYSYYSIKQHLDQVNYFTDIMAAEAFTSDRKSNLAMIVISPFFKFFKSYFLKMGFLDGYYGFVVCMISAHATFIKHVKTKFLFDHGQT